MPSFRKRYEAQQKKDTIQMLENLLRGLKNGTLKVDSFGYWRASVIGKYIYRVDVINLKESEVSDED